MKTIFTPELMHVVAMCKFLFSSTHFLSLTICRYMMHAQFFSSDLDVFFLCLIFFISNMNVVVVIKTILRYSLIVVHSQEIQ